MARIYNSIDRSSNQSQCCGKTVKTEHRTQEIGVTQKLIMGCFGGSKIESRDEYFTQKKSIDE